MTTDWTQTRPNHIPADLWENFTRRIASNATAAKPLAVKAEDLTFGVEIETHTPANGNLRISGYHSRATLGSRLPRSAQGGEWQAQHDSSIRTPNYDRTDCEFISPKLKGTAGLENLMATIRTIKAPTGTEVEFNGQSYEGCGGKVNASCGVHVHIAFPTNDLRCLQRLVALTAAFEQGIYASTGTKSRERGGYAKATKNSESKKAANASRREADFYREHRDHFCGLNLSNLINGRRPAVEFRFFSGSTNPVKIAAYVQLCLGLVQLALSMTRQAKWDPKPAGDLMYGNGPGEKELNKLLRRLEWVSGNGSFGPLGLLNPGERTPSLKGMIATLRGLAKAYDERG